MVRHALGAQRHMLEMVFVWRLWKKLLPGCQVFFLFVCLFVCGFFFKHLILSFLALIYFIFVLQNLTVMVLFPSSYSATNMFLADILLLRRIKPLKKIVLCFQKYVYLLSQGTDNYSSVLNTIYRAQGGLVVINSKFSNHQIG